MDKTSADNEDQFRNRGDAPSDSVVLERHPDSSVLVAISFGCCCPVALKIQIKVISHQINISYMKRFMHKHKIHNLLLVCAHQTFTKHQNLNSGVKHDHKCHRSQ